MQFSALTAVLLVLLCGVNAEYVLVKLDTEYLPTVIGQDGSDDVYEYNTQCVEQTAIDATQPIIYAVGLNNLFAIDFSNPSDMERVFSVAIGADLNTLEATDVEYCGGFVAVSIDDFITPLVGRVQIWTAYDETADPPMEKLVDIEVGSMPDMIKFTSNCSTLVVAVEAELREISVDGTTNVVDPEGEVTIIDFVHGIPGANYSMRVASFEKFNDLEEDYVQLGVRKIYNGQITGESTTFAQDMEPEYIQINSDNTRAYVVLQENNAMAVVDIAEADIIEIYPLGRREWANSSLDASDRDEQALLVSYPIYGYQNPDGMALITIDGEDYMLTANEGDAKEYETAIGNWEESQRAKNFESDDIADTVDSDLINDLGEDEKLGRLEMSVVDGLNDEGLYEEFYSYGSRDFSLYRVSDFTEVYNSGNDFERILEESDEFRPIFNTNPNSNDDSPEGAFDTRSDNKGPEPETVTYGEVDGDTLVFVAFERPGQILIYKLDNDGETPSFTYESINYFGGFGSSSTWEEMYDERTISDLGPEDLRFIPAADDDSVPLLVSASTYSGTVSIFAVQEEDDE